VFVGNRNGPEDNLSPHDFNELDEETMECSVTTVTLSLSVVCLEGNAV
jgi:hypothetical protein